MALPIIRAAAGRAGSAVTEQLGSVVEEAFVAPFRPLFKNVVVDTVKNIKADALALQDQTAEKLEETDDDLERLHEDNNGQTQLFEDMLEQLILANDLFQDQLTNAAAERVQKRRSEREEAIEEDAVVTRDVDDVDDDEAKKGGSFLGTLMRSIIGAAGLVGAGGLAVLAVKFKSAFTRIATFAARFIPVIAIVDSVIRYFDKIDEALGVPASELDTGDKVAGFAGIIFGAIGRIADYVAAAFGVETDFGNILFTRTTQAISQFIDGVFGEEQNGLAESAETTRTMIQELFGKFGDDILGAIDGTVNAIVEGVNGMREIGRVINNAIVDIVSSIPGGETALSTLGIQRIETPAETAERQVLENIESVDTGKLAQIQLSTQSDAIRSAATEELENRFAAAARISPEEEQRVRAATALIAQNADQSAGAQVTQYIDNRQYTTATSQSTSRTNVMTGGTGPKVAGISG